MSNPVADFMMGRSVARSSMITAGSPAAPQFNSDAARKLYEKIGKVLPRPALVVDKPALEAIKAEARDKPSVFATHVFGDRIGGVRVELAHDAELAKGLIIGLSMTGHKVYVCTPSMPDVREWLESTENKCGATNVEDAQQ